MIAPSYAETWERILAAPLRRMGVPAHVEHTGGNVWCVVVPTGAPAGLAVLSFGTADVLWGGSDLCGEYTWGCQVRSDTDLAKDPDAAARVRAMVLLAYRGTRRVTLADDA